MTEFMLVRPPDDSRTCRFCGKECEFYTVGHADDGTAYGHEPVPFTTEYPVGSPDRWVAITEDQARRHADWALSRGLAVLPDVLIALGYARYRERPIYYTIAGAAIAGKQPGELVP